MSISLWQNIGYGLAIVGAVLMAIDIMGPLLLRLERGLEGIVSFRFLNRMEDSEVIRRWVQPGKSVSGTPRMLVFLFGIGALLTFLDALGKSKRQTVSLREEIKFYFLISSIGFLVFVMAASLSLMLICVYAVTAIFNIFLRMSTSPYQLGLWFRERYGWSSPIRTIGLIVFLVGSVIYYAASK